MYVNFIFLPSSFHGMYGIVATQLNVDVNFHKSRQGQIQDSVKGGWNELFRIAACKSVLKINKNAHFSCLKCRSQMMKMKPLSE